MEKDRCPHLVTYCYKMMAGELYVGSSEQPGKNRISVLLW